MAGYSISDVPPLLAAHGTSQSVSFGHFVSTHVLPIAAVGVGFLAVVASAFIRDANRERRIYWVGWLIATALMSFAVLSRGWQASLGFALLCGFAATVYAYFQTSFLKIGGRIYAFSTNYVQPDSSANTALGKTPSPASHDSYSSAGGTVSACKLWWVLVVMTCVAATGVCLAGWVWQTTLGVVFLAVLSGIAGFDDAARKLPMARGQHVQAYIASVASILLWLAPPFCYFLGYKVGQRWPMGRGKRAAPPAG